jgi:hypothetical protein
MFLIRRIFDDTIPANQDTLEQVKAILRSQFQLLDRRKIDRIPESLRFSAFVFRCNPYCLRTC